VDREQLIAALGLAPDATDAQITDTIAALKQRADQVDPLTQQVATLKQAGTGNPDPARFVPIDTVTTLRNEVAALTTRLHGRELDELMTAGLADGRILPAMESWARELGGRDLAALRSYLDTAQPIAALAGSQTGGRSRAANDTGLTDAELAVCRQMGLTPDEFQKARGGNA
jgi:phage I-like protein